MNRVPYKKAAWFVPLPEKHIGHAHANVGVSKVAPLANNAARHDQRCAITDARSAAAPRTDRQRNGIRDLVAATRTVEK
jgi:hypothetical protein